ncbi:aspartate aminotransferase family protein [Paenibacillus crassostreae]|uniref:Aspartate aminotransferase family protein n=2 Tax=Paenibacillus crassostreae TaxID=1763538 RepID=A0A167FAX9_9BACL|nr:aspartate aminotransferase family protein [Paenibacillus crassostreae]AOZ90867.1 hypothetical protein LPB68_00700 [Paenibacillus crassostreae]OAB76366.1 hypothetical protein PNBC_02835 [Paenibacillus crassostreae]
MQMQEYIKNKPLIIQRSEGKYLFDDKNHAIYDGVSSLLNASYGHNIEQIISSMKEQLDILDNNSLFLSTNEQSVLLAKKIIELTNGHFSNVFFTNSGSEATETALKIARKYTFRKKGIGNGKVIALRNSYHGSTMCATLLSGNEHDIQGISFDAGFIQVPFPEPLYYSSDEIEEKVDEHILELREMVIRNPDVSAIITEIVQLSNKASVVPSSFLEKIRSLCNEFEILWIVDEIATGFGRTGSYFAYQSLDVDPDILLLGKAISGGYVPLGAVCVIRPIYDAFIGKVQEGNELAHGFTTSGHPLACNASLACIRFLEENNLVENANEKGHILFESLNKLIQNYDFVLTISGKGLLLSIIFKPGIKVPMMREWGIAHLISKRLIHYGLLLYPDSDDSLIIAPPLTITDEDIHFITDTLSEVFSLFSNIIAYE